MHHIDYQKQELLIPDFLLIELLLSPLGEKVGIGGLFWVL